MKRPTERQPLINLKKINLKTAKKATAFNNIN